MILIVSTVLVLCEIRYHLLLWTCTSTYSNIPLSQLIFGTKMYVQGLEQQYLRFRWEPVQRLK